MMDVVFAVTQNLWLLGTDSKHRWPSWLAWLAPKRKAHAPLASRKDAD